MNHPHTSVVLPVALTIAALCATPVPDAVASPAAACRSVMLTARSSGHSIVLAPCDRVTINLTEEFDGGYKWVASHAPAARVLKLVSDRAVKTTPPGVVGGTDRRVITYRAGATGQTSLTLVEERSFDKAHPIGTFTLSIRVR